MRYQLLTKTDPKVSKELLEAAGDDTLVKWKWMQDMQRHFEPQSPETTTPS
jgi:hypothetical protein